MHRHTRCFPTRRPRLSRTQLPRVYVRAHACKLGICTQARQREKDEDARYRAALAARMEEDRRERRKKLGLPEELTEEEKVRAGQGRAGLRTGGCGTLRQCSLTSRARRRACCPSCVEVRHHARQATPEQRAVVTL